MPKNKKQRLAQLVCGVWASMAMCSAWGQIGGVLPPLPAMAPLQPSTALHSQSQGVIYFPSSSPYDLDVLLFQREKAAPTTGMGQLYLPVGASADSPVPAVVVLPGDMQTQPEHATAVAQLLLKQGMAAFVLDYYQPRGVTPEMTFSQKMLAVSEFDILSDAYAALGALQSHPGIDRARIGLLGYARGGLVTRLAMDQRMLDTLAPGQLPFAVHVDVYGPCYADIAMTATTGKPLMALRGGEDASIDLSACATVEEQLRRAGSQVSAVVYDNAPHAWDSTQPREEQARPYLSGCTIRFGADGAPSVNGQALFPANAAPDRSNRQRLRAQAGRQLGSCVKYGVQMGQDHGTREAANVKLLQFLRSRL